MATRYDNKPETATLSPELQQLREDALQAWGHIRRTLDNWLTIGRFLTKLQAHADDMGGRFTFHRLMAQNGFEAMTDPKFKATLSRLLAITAREVEVLQWHRKLPEKKQADWHHPNTVFLHCPIFKKPERTEAELAAAQAAAKAKKIAAAQKLLGIKPGAPVPMAADWVPAGIGAKPAREVMEAKQAENAEAEAAEADEGLDYMNAFAGIDAVKNEAEPADFVAAMRELAAGDAAKMAMLSAKIDGLLVYFDKVKLALAAPPPKPKKARAKKGKKSAGKGAVASIAEPGLPKAEPAAAVATIEGASPFVEVAQKYAPSGYTFEYRKAVSGMHHGESKVIQTCKPVTAKSLYIFLHECAHAHLGHGHNGNVSRHVEEMQAEQFAHKAMAEAGIAVPPKMTERARRYVARKIVQAERRGATHIEPEALAYAGPDLVAEMHAKYEKWYGPRGHSRIKFRRA